MTCKSVSLSLRIAGDSVCLLLYSCSCILLSQLLGLTNSFNLNNSVGTQLVVSVLSKLLVSLLILIQGSSEFVFSL